MSQRVKSSGRSLADQSKRGKVVGKKIISVKKESQVERNPNVARLNKLGVVSIVENLFDEDNTENALNYAYQYADYLYKQETIFEPKYLLTVMLETLASMVDDLEAAKDYINSIPITKLILLAQLREYLGELESEEVTDYVLNRSKYFDPNTFEGKTRLIEYIQYVYEHQGDISALTKQTTFELDAPTETVQFLTRYIDEIQECTIVTRGVTDLGYCIDCNHNILTITEIQDRCGDEPKSQYISCSKCNKRGGNIRYYADEEPTEANPTQSITVGA